MSDWQNFSLQKDGGLYRLTLHTQCKGNAYNRLFWQELDNLLADLKHDSACRVLLIDAEGRHFGAGMNVDYLAELNVSKGDDPARYNHWIREKVLYLQAVISRLEALPMPVIAAARGACIGGSLAIFAACDLRLADSSAFFSIHETQIGIMCDLGTIQRLACLCGESVATRMSLTGARIDAEEALRVQLLSAPAAAPEALDAEARQLAENLMALSPLALSGVKRTLIEGRDMSFSASLSMSASWNGGMYTSPEIREAIAAQRERKAMDYRPLYGEVAQ